MNADRYVNLVAIVVASVAALSQIASRSAITEANRVAREAHESAQQAIAAAHDTEEKFQMLSKLLLEQGGGAGSTASGTVTKEDRLDLSRVPTDVGTNDGPVLGPKPGRRRD